jgi:hypothetical protein
VIFVFGSNLAGRHGKGAAQWARLHRGAVYGKGEGFQGQSYAIPTKDTLLKPLPLGSIDYYVKRFIRFANDHPNLTFELTPIGTGLAGYSVDEIAPMFAMAPDNVIFPDVFNEWFGNKTVE